MHKFFNITTHYRSHFLLRELVPLCTPVGMCLSIKREINPQFALNFAENSIIVRIFYHKNMYMLVE